MENIRRDSQKIKSKSNVEYAVDYARLGWSVVPVVRGTKVPPKGETWKNRRFLSASECPDEEWKKKHPDAVWGRATEAEIRAWWKKYPTAGIGILTGRISGIDVVDLDGPGAHEALEAEAEVELPDSISQTTGRADGGRHILFKYHGGGLFNKAAYVEGVDIRTDGGLFVVAPSVHKTGRQYIWDIDPTEMGLDDLEEFNPDLLSFLLNKCGDNGNGTGQREDRINPDKLFKEGIPDGRKHHDLFRFACQKIQQGITKEEALILATELARRCDPLPKDGPEHAAKVRVDEAWAKYGNQQDNGGSEDGEWEDPVLLDDFSLPEMEPVPGIIGEFSEAVSAATETPLELAQGLALAVVATACQGKVNVINLTNRFIAEVEASPMGFVIPREFSTRPYWFYGFDKDFMKLRYQ